MPKNIQFSILVVIIALFLPSALLAQDTKEDDQWQIGLELYGWLPNITGSTAIGSQIDAGQDDIIDTLQMTLQGVVAVSRGNWSLAADLVYLDVGDEQYGSIDFPSGIVNTTTDADLKTWIITPVVGYQIIENEKGKLKILGGARYLSLDLDGTINIATSTPLIRNFSDSGSIWDVVFGFKGEITLNDRWYLPFYIDIGTGDSDLTLQGVLSLAYKFDSFDVVAGYRYLHWDLDDNSSIKDLTVNGPYAGVKFFF